MIKILLLSTALIFLVGCGRDNIKNGTSSKTARSNDYANTHVYNKNSPYAKALEKCALIDNESDSCKLSELPILGQEANTITKEMIMNRLLVSHEWMGARFSQMLDRFSGKMIQQLFRATTAVVIDDDIIPAYYWAVTGAIYLDPRYIWQTAAEKKTITKREDYRAGFGTGLKFDEGTFFRQYNKSLYTFDKTDRSAAEAELSLAGLLYHELTHANDFIPPSMTASLNGNLSVLDNILNIGGNRTSEQLYASSPVRSQMLIGLGQVLFHGDTATDEQKQITGREVGELFDDDGTAAMYAYATRYEDTAMLFQTVMMKYFYNVDGYQVFFDPDEYEKSGTFEWGIKNPVLKENVLDRAVFVANHVLPIGGGWEERLHGIQDAPVRIANIPTFAHGYMAKPFKFDKKEFQKSKPISID